MLSRRLACLVASACWLRRQQRSDCSCAPVVCCLDAAIVVSECCCFGCLRRAAPNRRPLLSLLSSLLRCSSSLQFVEWTVGVGTCAAISPVAPCSRLPSTDAARRHSGRIGVRVLSPSSLPLQQRRSLAVGVIRDASDAISSSRVIAFLARAVLRGVDADGRSQQPSGRRRPPRHAIPSHPFAPLTPIRSSKADTRRRVQPLPCRPAARRASEQLQSLQLLTRRRRLVHRPSSTTMAASLA